MDDFFGQRAAVEAEEIDRVSRGQLQDGPADSNRSC